MDASHTPAPAPLLLMLWHFSPSPSKLKIRHTPGSTRQTHSASHSPPAGYGRQLDSSWESLNGRPAARTRPSPALQPPRPICAAKLSRLQPRGFGLPPRQSQVLLKTDTPPACRLATFPCGPSSASTPREIKRTEWRTSKHPSVHYTDPPILHIV